MKTYTYWFLIAAVPALALIVGGCSPSSSIVGDAEKTFRTVAESESKGQIMLVSFTKKDGRKIESLGVQAYELLYDAEIKFVNDGTWITGATTESGIGFNFEVLTGERPKSISADLLNFSMGGKPVSRGNHAKISGKMIGEKYESGWKFKIADGDVNLVSSSETRASDPQIANSPVAMTNDVMALLRVIDAAKQQFALDNSKEETYVPTEEELKKYLQNSYPLKHPKGGRFIIHAIKYHPESTTYGSLWGATPKDEIRPNLWEPSTNVNMAISDRGSSEVSSKLDKEALEWLAVNDREYIVYFTTKPEWSPPEFCAGKLSAIRFLESDLQRGKLKAVIGPYDREMERLALAGDISGDTVTLRSTGPLPTNGTFERMMYGSKTSTGSNLVIVLPLQQSNRFIAGKYEWNKWGDTAGTIKIRLDHPILWDADSNVMLDLNSIGDLGKELWEEGNAFWVNGNNHDTLRFPASLRDARFDWRIDESRFSDQDFIYVSGIDFQVSQFGKDKRIILFRNPNNSRERVIPVYCLDQNVRKYSREELGQLIKKQTGKSVAELVKQNIAVP